MRNGMSTILAAVVLLICGYAWLILSWDTVAVAFWPSGRRFAVSAALLPLIGVVVAAAFAAAQAGLGRSGPPEWGRSGSRDWSRPSPPWVYAEAHWARLGARISLAMFVAIWALAVLLLVAVDRKADPMRAALVLVCGAATLIVTAYGLAALVRGQPVEMSSHWGGLGGGIGGWQLSPPTVALLLALVFLGATIAIGGGEGGEANNQTSNEALANQAAGDTEANRAEANAAAANTAAPAAVNEAAANGTEGPG